MSRIAQQKTTKRFWLVLPASDGQRRGLYSAAPSYRYQTIEEARAEATRLSWATDLAFYVVQAVERVSRAAPPPPPPPPPVEVLVLTD